VVLRWISGWESSRSQQTISTWKPDGYGQPTGKVYYYFIPSCFSQLHAKLFKREDSKLKQDKSKNWRAIHISRLKEGLLRPIQSTLTKSMFGEFNQWWNYNAFKAEIKKSQSVKLSLAEQ